jgi:hypothetical protein
VPSRYHFGLTDLSHTIPYPPVGSAIAARSLVWACMRACACACAQFARMCTCVRRSGRQGGFHRARAWARLYTEEHRRAQLQWCANNSIKH